MGDENKIINSFSLQETLNPIIWDNPDYPQKSNIFPEIRKKLLEVAYEFMEFIDMDFFVDDIVLTGSISNFNWSEFSDIDLHLEVDFGQFDSKTIDLYKELFNLKKLLFNSNHNIEIKNFQVEVYIQDITETHTSGGIYSLLFNKWNKIPKKEIFDID